MTLSELSVVYRQDAAALRMRIAVLREEERGSRDAELARALRVRIAVLEPLVREMRELGQLTEHYYDRGYYRNDKYTL